MRFLSPGRRPGRCTIRFDLVVPLFALAVLMTPGRYAQQPQGQGGSPTARPIDRLQAIWPAHPEWVAMFVDILSGSQLGPGDGWFRKAVAQTRYPWKRAASEWDRDGDGRIRRAEFGGSDADFARLDRDRDGALTPTDFDFSAHALTPSPGMLAFYRADRDGNGKVTRAEFESLFRTFGGDETGFLSLADFQQGFAFPPRRSTTSGTASSVRSSGPSRQTLIRGLFRQEIGSLQAGPKLDEVAPDFTLKTVNGQEEKTLSHLVGTKPVVLIFGNFTCGPFRSQAGNVEKVYKRYRDRANFLMVYVREAHPTDGWQMESNDRVGVALRQPQSYDERVSVAQTCSKSLGLGMPMLVDTLDDQVGARYSGMPSRLYVIDRQGKVAFKSGRGPFGFKPEEMEQALIFTLREDSGASKGPSPADRPTAETSKESAQPNEASGRGLGSRTK